MQFQISTLGRIETVELIETFNRAFAGYFVEIKLDEKSFADKIALENIVLEKSVGAFANGKLVGFALLGFDDFDGGRTAYNGGTGVVPEFRGNNLTARIYDFILSEFGGGKFCFHQLEVIRENRAAIKTYEKIGFEISRVLSCFRGNIAPSEINQTIEIRFLDDVDERLFTTFWNAQPSWQNSLSAVRRTKHLHKIVGAFADAELIGYLIYTDDGRIKQFAVRPDFRHSGVARTLFAFVRSKLDGKEVVIPNVAKSDVETCSFLRQAGLTCFLEQFEMKLKTLRVKPLPV